eukprot:15478755-Alexandrium_andersonii.AAC.1
MARIIGLIDGITVATVVVSFIVRAILTTADVTSVWRLRVQWRAPETLPAPGRRSSFSGLSVRP